VGKISVSKPVWPTVFNLKDLIYFSRGFFEVGKNKNQNKAVDLYFILYF
jgi:hypothetical protein